MSIYLVFFAGAAAVHIHLAGGDGGFALHGLGGQLDDIAVIGDGHAVGGDAHLLGQPPMDLQHALLTVEGDEEPRTHQCVDDLQFFLAGVAGNMQAFALFIYNFRAFAVQFVNPPMILNRSNYGNKENIYKENR